MEELRIPKVSVDIICHTVHQEVLSGEIFLDQVSTAGYTTAQVLEFFNSPDAYFPLRVSTGKSILLQKLSLLRVDVQGLFHEYETEVYSSVDLKREAVLHMTNGMTLRGNFIIDMPYDHARTLDLLNVAGRHFVPFLLEDTINLIHTLYLYKVEEN
ncbi:hypothetical protein L0222_23370 [bacterium]|nr:hypothetical protein [bacterium]MCI0601418.1 hypothetical protein [bacterium]